MPKQIKQKTFEKDTVLRIENGDGQYSAIVALRENEWIQWDHKHTFHGPSIVVRIQTLNGITNIEYHVDSPEFWHWMARLAQHALPTQKVLVNMQGPTLEPIEL